MGVFLPLFLFLFFKAIGTAIPSIIPTNNTIMTGIQIFFFVLKKLQIISDKGLDLVLSISFGSDIVFTASLFVSEICSLFS